jgi:hypothetical protein
VPTRRHPVAYGRKRDFAARRVCALLSVARSVPPEAIVALRLRVRSFCQRPAAQVPDRHGRVHQGGTGHRCGWPYSLPRASSKCCPGWRAHAALLFRSRAEAKTISKHGGGNTMKCVRIRVHCADGITCQFVHKPELPPAWLNVRIDHRVECIA